MRVALAFLVLCVTLPVTSSGSPPVAKLGVFLNPGVYKNTSMVIQVMRDTVRRMNELNAAQTVYPKVAQLSKRMWPFL